MFGSAILTIAAALIFAMPANAGTAIVGYTCELNCGEHVTFQATPAERNVLSVEQDPFGTVLRDSGAPISPGPGCAAIEGGVKCASAAEVRAFLGDGDDVFTGAGLIRGENGNDRITASSKGRYSGGPGNDVVIGAGQIHDDDGDVPGRDVYIGIAGFASVNYDTRSDGVHIDLRRSHPSEDRIVGIPAIHGGLGDDVLIGDDGPNVLDGGQAGHDRVRGLGGDDSLHGEEVDGGTGNDRVARDGDNIGLLDCGPGMDEARPRLLDLVGADCERLFEGTGPQLRARLPTAGSAFLLGIERCEACAVDNWIVTARGRAVGALSAAGNLRLKPIARRWLRREGVLRVRVHREYEYSPTLHEVSGFRVDLRIT